jgi:hypothetical protein
MLFKKEQFNDRGTLVAQHVISNCARVSFTFISDHCAVHRLLVNIKIAHNVHRCTFFHTEFKTQATWVIIYSKKAYNVHCCVFTFIFSTRLFSVELAWARKSEVIFVVTRFCEIYMFAFCLFLLNKFINMGMSNSKRRKIENENRT